MAELLYSACPLPTLPAVRYAGRLAKLCPATPEGCAEADMMVELANEMNAINPIVNWFEFGSEDFQKACDNYFAALPSRLASAQRILGSQKFYGGGDGPCFGDFALFHILDNTLLVRPDALETFPGLYSWFQTIQSLTSIKSYMANRPGKHTPGWGKPGSYIMTH